MIHRWTWAPRGLLLPLAQKTARARLATEISPRHATRLSPGRSEIWARRGTAHHLIGPPRAVLRERRENGTARRHAEYLSARVRTVATDTTRPPYCTTMRTTARVNRCSNGRRSAASASTGCPEYSPRLRPAAIYDRNPTHFYFTSFNKPLLNFDLCNIYFIRMYAYFSPIAFFHTAWNIKL